jgi:hypothetical protein
MVPACVLLTRAEEGWPRGVHRGSRGVEGEEEEEAPQIRESSVEREKKP